MTTQENKRKRGRLPVNRPCRIRLGNGPEQQSQLVDISLSGAMLFYAQSIELGTAVELRFAFITGTRTECLVYGHVRHNTARGTSHVIGVEFTHFEPEAYEAIRQFVEQQAGAVR